MSDIIVLGRRFLIIVGQIFAYFLSYCNNRVNTIVCPQKVSLTETKQLRTNTCNQITVLTSIYLSKLNYYYYYYYYYKTMAGTFR